MTEAIMRLVKATTDFKAAMVLAKELNAPYAVLGVSAENVSGSLWIVDGQSVVSGKVLPDGEGGLGDIAKLLTVTTGQFSLHVSAETPVQCPMKITINDFIADRGLLIKRIAEYKPETQRVGRAVDPDQTTDVTFPVMKDPDQTLDSTIPALHDPNQTFDVAFPTIQDPNQTVDVTFPAIRDPNQTVDALTPVTSELVGTGASETVGAACMPPASPPADQSAPDGDMKGRLLKAIEEQQVSGTSWTALTASVEAQRDSSPPISNLSTPDAGGQFGDGYVSPVAASVAFSLAHTPAMAMPVLPSAGDETKAEDPEAQSPDSLATSGLASSFTPSRPFRSVFGKKAAEMEHEERLKNKLDVEAQKDDRKILDEEKRAKHRITSIARDGRKKEKLRVPLQIVGALTIGLAFVIGAAVAMTFYSDTKTKQDNYQQEQAMELAKNEVETSTPLAQSPQNFREQYVPPPAVAPVAPVENRSAQQQEEQPASGKPARGQKGGHHERASGEQIDTPRDQGDLGTRMKQGDDLMASGDTQGAIEAYSVALGKYPKSLQLRLTLARAHMKLRQYAEAKQVCLEGMTGAASQKDFEELNAMLKQIPQ